MRRWCRWSASASAKGLHTGSLVNRVLLGIAEVAGNYPSRGSVGERAAWFRDSEGNLFGIGQAVEVRRCGIVDEYRLFVYPVVLGHGERLFADATEVPRLRLVEALPFRSGIVLLRYLPM